MSGGQATVSRDPGVGFWLRYAEAEGALSEDQGDQALVVLPETLQQRFALDDVVAVTADPEVAREDGALLLLPGHPALDGAATLAVQQGDAGTAWLPWPDRRPPRTSELLERAREAVAVEHGRLDRDRDAARAWLPLLRVGALATTTASLDLRFQERHEVWVDARTGTEVPDALLEVLTGSSWSHEPGQRHAVLAADLARSVAAADRLLSDRAATRADALSARAGDDRRDALARVAAYYDKALATIRRRREAADDDERRALLDAQAEATQLERERRCQEVEDTHRVRFELQPFRLHLVMVPTLRLPLRVRRGATTFPLELVWVLPTRTFAPVTCPHCGREAALVAGRRRLGCTSCLPRPVRTADGDDATTREAHAGPVTPDAEAGCSADDGGATAPTPSQGHGRPAPAPPGRSAGGTTRPRRSAGASTPPRRSAGASASPRRSAGASTSPRARARQSAERLQVVGDRLALRFWDEVALGRRWHRRRVAADSPLTTLHRLYGKTAPLVAVGVPGGDSPESIHVHTQAPEPGLPCVTHGELRSGSAVWTFTLRWEPASSGPVLLELLPGLPMLDGHLPTPWAVGWAVAERLFGPADPPIGLDPVAEALWRAGRPVGGLPLVVRCLTAWWRSAEHLDADAAPAVVAAALTSLVENRSGLRRSRAQAAADHGVSVKEVAGTAQLLQRRLELSSQRPW
jgi:hypothetical protein